MNARHEESPVCPVLESLEARLLLDGGPLITEFLASNGTPWYPTNPDSNWDWIEVYNPTAEAVNLEGWHLTDDRGDLDKWTFPAGVVLAPDAYKVVFASGLKDGDPAHPADLHANFKLGAGDPEYLALVKPRAWQEDVVYDYYPTYPVQLEGISYGLPPAAGVETELVATGAASTYHVPAAGEDVTAWAGPTFDDSAWTGSAALGPAGIAITEIGTGATRFVEIQNVVDHAVDTTGWSVLVNDASGGNINAVSPVAWALPSSVSAATVLYRTDSPTDNYWGGAINWNAEGPGWAMVLDGGGHVRDYVAWGYTAAQIASLGITYGGFANIKVGDQWAGDGAAPGATEPGGTGDPAFVAFNDHVAGTGTNVNATLYAANGAASGLLKNIDTGAGTAVTLTVSQHGVAYATNGAAPASGTDAYTLFNGFVDFLSGTGASIEIGGADDYTFAFTGLDTGDAFTYDFAGTSIRGSSSYTNRWTLVTLQGADAATPAHSTGNGVVVISPTQVALWTGYNSAAGQGFVAAWTGIDPGTDGAFSVVSTQYTGATPGVGTGTANGTKGYALTGMRLRAMPTTAPLSWLQRTGDHDGNRADDFVRARVASKGAANAGLVLPFASATAAATGLGFSNQQPDYAANIRTDVGSVMKGVNASLWTRIEFEAGDLTALDGLTLRMKYDDGFVAYLNGVEVARRNAPDTLLWDSSATAAQPDAQAVVFEDIDVSDYLVSLQAGTNVLAIHGLNVAAADADFLVLPELIARRTLGDPQYMTTPTPGADNLVGALGVVKDTKFSVDRGFYDAPFDVAITTDTAGATVYYTTDGAKPGPTVPTAHAYTGPLHISKTTTLRAMAYKAGYLDTGIDTHTYIFLDDVVGQTYQSIVNAGFPAAWKSVAADYGLDPDVIGTFDADGNPLGGDLYGGLYAAAIRDSLASLPTLSIVMNAGDMFGTTGIYSNPTSTGITWERETSAELIYPDGTEGFQIECGIRIQGAYFRGTSIKKHSFRLLFKDAYGAAKLNYAWFGEDAADQFDTITLRANGNDGYTWNGAKYTEQFIRDAFGHELQLATGNASSHATFVHLYVNGVYWGLYNPVERPDDSFSAAYYGGEKENWDVVHDAEAVAGNLDAWKQMIDLTKLAANADPAVSNAAFMQLQGKNPDGTRNPAYPVLLDMANYVDYLILNIWGGNWDWPNKNWYAARDRSADSTGFKFYIWDYENTMGNSLGRSPLNMNVLLASWTKFSGDGTAYKNAAEPHWSLVQNAEYRQLFADRVQKFFFNGGVLTPESLIPRYAALAAQVEQAVVAESARWGDMFFHPPLTQADWIDADRSGAGRDWILYTYLPQRTGIVLQQLKNAGLYSATTAAPAMSQLGGEIDPGFNLTLSAAAGTIWYTLDGTDPRLMGGTLAPGALQYVPGTSTITLTKNTLVKARVLDAGGMWSAIEERTFVLTTLPDLVVTEIMYNPAPPTAAEIAAGFTDAGAFEFVEFQNVGSQAINLAGVRIANGVDFTFPSFDLAPGNYVLVVNDARAFALRYPSVPAGRVAGEFGNSTLLDSAGERVGVGTVLGRAIQDFSYRDGWFNQTDGAGFSLVVRSPLQDRALWDSEDGWRASWQAGGNPAAADPSPLNPGDVVINEILAHSDGELGDWVEIRNMTDDRTFDLTGWFLSDSADFLDKYALPATILGPGQYAVFNELNHFGSAFALSELGDDLYLTSRAPDGTPGGYREDEHFGASDRNVTLGRFEKPSGGKDFIPLSAPTCGTPNAPPLVGPIVINEIMYHPLTGDEFIELRNLTDQDVPLHDSQPAANPWEFSDGIEFEFPAGAYVPANGYALVVKGNPAVFRAANGIPAEVPIYGPYAPFALDNAGETIILSRPGDPEADGFVPYILVEKITYNNKAPWPPEADGLGPSLSRVASGAYANDVVNWRPSAATGGTPGAQNDVDPPARIVEVVLNPAGPGQTRTYRTVGGIEPGGMGIVTIQIVFSAAVDFANTAVEIRKVTFDGATEVPAPEKLSPLNVSGAGTATMQIEFATLSTVDTWVKVRLSAAGITSAGTGTPLDGEPRTNSSGLGYLYQAAADLPTGDGLPGGDAVFYMGSLRGDFNGDGYVTPDDKAGFLAAWNAKSLDADFRGVGYGVRPPDGRVTLGDIDGFTSVYLAAVATSRRLDPLPTSVGGQSAAATRPALATSLSPGADILAEAAGQLPAGQQTPLLVAGQQGSSFSQDNEESLDPIRVRRVRPAAVADASGPVVLRI